MHELAHMCATIFYLLAILCSCLMVAMPFEWGRIFEWWLRGADHFVLWEIQIGVEPCKCTTLHIILPGVHDLGIHFVGPPNWHDPLFPCCHMVIDLAIQVLSILFPFPCNVMTKFLSIWEWLAFCFPSLILLRVSPPVDTFSSLESIDYFHDVYYCYVVVIASCHAMLPWYFHQS